MKAKVFYLAILLALLVSLAIAIVPASPVFAATLNVPSVPYPTIQAAVNAASPGDTINVAAGTYTEQVTITKSLDLIGAGEATTTILAPATRTGSVTHNATVHDYLLAAYATSGTIDVRVQGFTLNVNGQNKTSGTGQMDGVFFRDVKDAGGTPAGLFSSTIHNFAATPEYEAFGVVVYGDSILTVNDNDISDYTRDGISINRYGSGLAPNVTISGNTVMGSATALNGINIDTVTAGAVTGNTVTGNTRSAPWAGGGIVVWTSTGLTISGNHVDGNFYGIDLLDGSHDITISGNELTSNIKRGISLGGISATNNNTVSGNTITGPAGGTDDVGIGIANGSTGNMIGGPTPADGNIITTAMTGPGTAMRRGIQVEGSVGPGNTIEYNTVTCGGYAGIVIDTGAAGQKINNNYVHDSLGGGFAINAQTAEFNNNRILDNGFGIEMGAAGATFVLHYNSIAGNDPAGTACALYGVCSSGLSVYDGSANAENNWWGAASGPSGVGPGSGDAVSANVDYDPWLIAAVGDSKTETVTDSTVDAKAEADTEVVVTGTATVSVASYTGDPPGSGFTGDVGKYIDVHVSGGPPTEIEIRLYFTSGEVAGPDESSLRMMYWDGSAWLACSDTGVNQAANYIWAKIRSDTTPDLAYLSGGPFGGGSGGGSGVPVFPSVPIGIAAVLAAGFVAFALRKRIVSRKS